MTKEEIERRRDSICAAIAMVEGVSPESYDKHWRETNELCDLALQSLSQESVRSEALEGKVAKLITNKRDHVKMMSGGDVTCIHVALLEEILVALSPARVAEGEPFPVELMSHSMDDDKRLMARKILKLQRVEKAYCAANDYINALATSSIPAESLEKIKAAYWQAVKEVQ